MLLKSCRWSSVSQVLIAAIRCNSKYHAGVSSLSVLYCPGVETGCMWCGKAALVSLDVYRKGFLRVWNYYLERSIVFVYVHAVRELVLSCRLCPAPYCEHVSWLRSRGEAELICLWMSIESLQWWAFVLPQALVWVRSTQPVLAFQHCGRGTQQPFWTVPLFLCVSFTNSFSPVSAK